MKVLVLGGDGYLGWPTSIHLSSNGYDVTVVDNYFRRDACSRLNIPPLFPVDSLSERCSCWWDITGHKINLIEGDITEYEFMLGLVKKVLPDVIIHYAEQPSAPYSMRSYEDARFTISNNLIGTLNVAYAVKEVDASIHIIKLGTMGEYGTPNIDIEEGYIDIMHKGRQDRFLYPRQAGSIYHTTKIHDTDLLYFFVRSSDLRVTDLMQGPVYGLKTTEMGWHKGLSTFFNYDGIFGTVINRFIVQAVVGMPLTVYGTGGQTRGYLNINDTLQCIKLAIESPPGKGELRVFNQFTETFTVYELAEKVVAAADLLGIKSRIENIPNPRLELEEHYYNPTNDSLIELGLAPHLLDSEALTTMLKEVAERSSEIRVDIVKPKISWH